MTINAIDVQDPTDLNEKLIPIETISTSINGGVQRDRIGTKKYALVAWTALAPAEYQALLAFFEPGTAVAYLNNNSNRGTFSFSGLPLITREGDYIRGGTFLRDLEVEFREV